MTRIVVVHGIGKQLSGPELLASELVPALQSGVTLAGGPRIAPEDIGVAFYGNILRRTGTRIGTVDHTADDLDGFETELLAELWEEAARNESAVPGLDAATRGRTPRFVQRALDASSHSRFLAGIAERMMIASLKQVRAYLTDPAIRSAQQLPTRVIGCAALLGMVEQRGHQRTGDRLPPCRAILLPQIDQALVLVEVARAQGQGALGAAGRLGMQAE